MEPLLDIDPLTALVDEVRFTSLLGGNCAGLLPGFESMGAAEPWENVSDGESGPTLDLGLLVCELGIVDNLRIQDPLDETDSLLVSSPTRSCCDGISPLRTTERLRPPPLCDVSALVFKRRVWGVMCCGAGDESMVVWKGRLSGVITVELVPGLDIGEDEPGAFLPASAKSPAFLFFEEGRTEAEFSGLPSARPAAAIPTVLDATSYTQLVNAFQIF